ncbi:MAG TPA: hypothetical protein VJS86_00650 [Arthrobacter sp.]|nr:hypothetical protein [Arthrobacter sp.]
MAKGYGPAVSRGISTPHSAIARVMEGEAEAGTPAEAGGAVVVMAEAVALADVPAEAALLLQ